MASSPTLADYLARVGFAGEPRVDHATLAELHRCHLHAVSYENIDVQLGRPVDLDIDRIRRKVIADRRGGWCYEMNGVFAWALEQIGFTVRRLGAAVARESSGRDDTFGAHLVLSVPLDGDDWLCDVGFGDGFVEPVPLVEGAFEQRGFRFELVRAGEYWRLRNHEFGGAPSFDFAHREVDPAELERMCRFLQTSSESPFTQWLVAQRFVEGGYETQTGLLARSVRPHGVLETVIETPEALLTRLRDVFELEVAGLAGLWPRLEARHEEYEARRRSG